MENIKLWQFIAIAGTSFIAGLYCAVRYFEQELEAYKQAFYHKDAAELHGGKKYK